jgi:hypothetical protein
MSTITRILLSALCAGGVAFAAAAPQTAPDPQWGVHDMNRPLPTVLDPGPALLKPVAAPPGAIVLFDGKDLLKWEDGKGGSAKWKVEKGTFEVVPKTGGIQTRDAFGSCHLHVEWASPSPAKGEGQDRGNSGVFLMNNYEVQVLDSYESRTYADAVQRLPEAGRMADLRHRFPAAGLRQGRQGRPAGPDDRHPQRNRRPELRPVDRTHRPQGAAAV